MKHLDEVDEFASGVLGRTVTKRVVRQADDVGIVLAVVGNVARLAQRAKTDALAWVDDKTDAKHKIMLNSVGSLEATCAKLGQLTG